MKAASDAAPAHSPKEERNRGRSALAPAAATGSSDTRTGASTTRRTCPISTQATSRYSTETRSKSSTARFQMQRETAIDSSITQHSLSQAGSCTHSLACVGMQSDSTHRSRAAKKTESSWCWHAHRKKWRNTLRCQTS